MTLSFGAPLLVPHMQDNHNYYHHAISEINFARWEERAPEDVTETHDESKTCDPLVRVPMLNDTSKK